MISSKNSKKKKYGKVRSVPKKHNGSPNSLIQINENAGSQSIHSSLNEFFENDQPVVKNHGKTDFAETSKKRSRRTHRSNRTEHISTEPLLGKIRKDKVMATSDIGLQNVT